MSPEPPCPASPSPNVFFSNLLSLCQSKIGQPLTSPTAPPDSFLPLFLARLNPGCQSAVLLCAAALCSTRSSALSAGDRLFGIYPLLLCLSLLLQPFSWQKKRNVSPPPYPLPLFSSTLTLQISSFHHPPTAPSPSPISAPNPILLKTVIE